MIAAVDIDTSGDGSAAVYDGEEGIATDGDSFCSITNDIAGGRLSMLFEGIVGGCDDNLQVPNRDLGRLHIYKESCKDRRKIVSYNNCQG